MVFKTFVSKPLSRKLGLKKSSAVKHRRAFSINQLKKAQLI